MLDLARCTGYQRQQWSGIPGANTLSLPLIGPHCRLRVTHHSSAGSRHPPGRCHPLMNRALS
eukprot:5808128-Pyramimonas_sp.AAC.1